MAFGDLSFGFGRSDLLRLVSGPAALASFQTFLQACSPRDGAWFGSRSCKTSIWPGDSLLCYTDGSFTPANEDQPALLGWAVAFFRGVAGTEDCFECMGIASGPFPLFFQDDEHLPSAFIAECCALCYAALLNVVLFPGTNVTLVSDFTAAITTATGGAAAGSLKVQHILRGLHALRPASSDGRVTYWHTKSHSKEVPNEKIDTASRMASHGRFLGTCTFSQPELWCRGDGQALIWAATAAVRGDTMLLQFVVLASGMTLTFLACVQRSALLRLLRCLQITVSCPPLRLEFSLLGVAGKGGQTRYSCPSSG